MTVKVDKQKNEICIFLNKDFYNMKVVKDALEDFKEVCNGKIKDDEKNKIKVILKPYKTLEINILGYEFCNYSLGLMKNYLIV